MPTPPPLTHATSLRIVFASSVSIARSEAEAFDCQHTLLLRVTPPPRKQAWPVPVTLTNTRSTEAVPPARPIDVPPPVALSFSRYRFETVVDGPPTTSV